MLLKNLSDTLCNGSRGVVLGFEPALFNQEDEDPKLLLDYITIRAGGDLTEEEEDKHNKNNNNNSEYDDEKYDFNNGWNSNYYGGNRIVYPVVKFANGEIRTIYPADFSVETKWGRAVRRQLPLKVTSNHLHFVLISMG